MTIKGLRNNGQTGLARAGVIRLGYKARKCGGCGRITEPGDGGATCVKCGQKLPDVSFPRESPHFILTDAPGLAETLGTEAPTELKVFFPFDEIERVFPNFMQLWSASSLVCRGDGEVMVYAINPQSGRVTVRDGVVQELHTEGGTQYQPGDVLACPGLERNLYPKCAHCKPNAMLIIMLREVPRLAYYQISTTSIHNIISLTNQLEYVREQVQKLTGAPRIAGVPFILRRVKKSISAPNLDKNGQRKKDRNGELLPPKQRVDKYFLELEIEPAWIGRMVQGISRLADPLGGGLASASSAGALPATVSTGSPAAGSGGGEMPASHFAEPPRWEPRPDDDEVIEGEWGAEVLPPPQPSPCQGEGEGRGGELPVWAKPEDFLHQLWRDFGLSESEARALLKRLGYTGWPKNGEARAKSVEMYRAVEKNQLTVKSEQLTVNEWEADDDELI